MVSPDELKEYVEMYGTSMEFKAKSYCESELAGELVEAARNGKTHLFVLCGNCHACTRKLVPYIVDYLKDNGYKAWFSGYCVEIYW